MKKAAANQLKKFTEELNAMKLRLETIKDSADDIRLDMQSEFDDKSDEFQESDEGESEQNIITSLEGAVSSMEDSLSAMEEAIESLNEIESGV